MKRIKIANAKEIWVGIAQQDIPGDESLVPSFIELPKWPKVKDLIVFNENGYDIFLKVMATYWEADVEGSVIEASFAGSRQNA